MSNRDADKLRTLAVHAGEPRPPSGDAITMPLYTSSTYVLGEPESFDDIRYIRLNNTPNQLAVSQKLAALEGTEDAVVTASGTAAITFALMAFLKNGDHLIVQDRLYGGTYKVIETLLKNHGVDASWVSGDDPADWQGALQPNTKVFLAETLTNPLLEVGALDEIAVFARQHSLISMIDNTFTTPVGFRPVTMGYDLVLHSASKYLNGHSDVVAGVVAGSIEHVERVRKMMNLAGVCLDPRGCYSLHRGLKTLPLRVAAQNENALALARALRDNPFVEHVHFPGLEDDPSHARAREWFNGYAAILSFVPIGGLERAERVMAALEYATVAPSLGGVETLVCRPATTTHAGIDSKTRGALGIRDDLIRVSVGIEDPQVLIDDFSQAILGASR